MYEITIWAKYKNRGWEAIDTCMEDEYVYLLNE